MLRSAQNSFQVLCFGVFIFLGILTYFTDARTSSQLKVKLEHGGVLVGRHLTSLHGRHFRAFLGVPYAKPPLGELRFKEPVPYDAWVGDKLVIKDSDKCIQRDPFRGETKISGSEDCIYLNVFVPEEPQIKKPLPVMVWFHGGAFECGSGISEYYGPKYIMDRDVIYVPVNYRLGPLGFLSTETLDCPGNNGLKDQTMALEWVQTNIAAFGGDPKRVTIFGESAGGASVSYHMLSKKSQGLFQNAIAQSGTFYNPWAQPAYPGVPKQRAAELSKIVGCDTSSGNWQNILNCLRTKPAADITAAFYDFFKWEVDPMIPFPPVVEPEHDGAFLSYIPRNQEPSNFNSKPLMIGFTSDEGLLRTVGIINRPRVLKDFKTKFSTVLPIVLNYDHFSQDRQIEINKALKNFYLSGTLNFDKENHQNLTDMVSDGWFIYGIDEHLRHRLSVKSSAQTYVYIFDHKGSASLTEIFHGGEHFYGTCHADELLSLFPIAEDLFVTASPTKRDRDVRDAMLDLWVNFATTSNPTPSDTKLLKWPAAKSYPPKFMRISSKNEEDPILTLSEDYPLERVNFWHNIKPYMHIQTQNTQHQEL